MSIIIFVYGEFLWFKNKFLLTEHNKNGSPEIGHEHGRIHSITDRQHVTHTFEQAPKVLLSLLHRL